MVRPTFLAKHDHIETLHVLCSAIEKKTDNLCVLTTPFRKNNMNSLDTSGIHSHHTRHFHVHGRKVVAPNSTSQAVAYILHTSIAIPSFGRLSE